MFYSLLNTGWRIPAEEVDDLEFVCEAFISSDSDVVPLERRLVHVCNASDTHPLKTRTKNASRPKMAQRPNGQARLVARLV